MVSVTPDVCAYLLSITRCFIFLTENLRLSLGQLRGWPIDLCSVVYIGSVADII